MTKDEIDHILESCMNNKELRKEFTFIGDYETFKTPRDFIEHLFLYGLTTQEIKDYIKRNHKILRKEKLQKLKSIN